eukprot:GHVU01010831.1.p2 GENE.GHVU01010831.1~~GHVU01010831.1.p2  ORF type:complete len:119 (+),score=6.19 GHVU01010831.1:402-758(+)
MAVVWGVEKTHVEGRQERHYGREMPNAAYCTHPCGLLRLPALEGSNGGCRPSYSPTRFAGPDGKRMSTMLNASAALRFLRSTSYSSGVSPFPCSHRKAAAWVFAVAASAAPGPFVMIV